MQSFEKKSSRARGSLQTISSEVRGRASQTTSETISSRPLEKFCGRIRGRPRNFTKGRDDRLRWSRQTTSSEDLTFPGPYLRSCTFLHLMGAGPPTPASPHSRAVPPRPSPPHSSPLSHHLSHTTHHIHHPKQKKAAWVPGTPSRTILIPARALRWSSQVVV